MEAVHIIMLNDYEKVNEVSKIDVKAQRAKQSVSRMNNNNWQYFILQVANKETPINDYESMMIGARMK